jgi:hypothetical protein
LLVFFGSSICLKLGENLLARLRTLTHCHIGAVFAKARGVNKRQKILTLIFLPLFVGTSVSSQQRPNPFKERVQIEIKADEALESELSSYLKRGFRSLGDVEQVESKPNLYIHIVAMTVKSRGNTPLGFSLSVLITRPLDPDLAKDVLSNSGIDQKYLTFITGFMKGGEVPLSHLLRTGGRDELETMCKKLVADIDTEFVEPERKLWQQLEDAQKTH